MVYVIQIVYYLVRFTLSRTTTCFKSGRVWRLGVLPLFYPCSLSTNSEISDSSWGSLWMLFTIETGCWGYCCDSTSFSSFFYLFSGLLGSFSSSQETKLPAISPSWFSTLEMRLEVPNASLCDLFLFTLSEDFLLNSSSSFSKFGLDSTLD